MGLARFIKWIGLIALVAGIIGFLLPGNFIYSPTIDSYLSMFGNALFPGISSNPMVKTIIAKAPVVLLAVIGFIMLFWGSMKDLTEPEETMATKPKDSKKTIKGLIDNQKDDEKNQQVRKSVRELADRKKP